MKGPELWLLTAAELKRRHGSHAFRFRWVGVNDALEGRQFEDMVRKLELLDTVESASTTPSIREEYRGMDILLVSSWEEPSSRATMEAMAAGQIVACFRGSGGPAELIGDAGIIVDGFSPTMMADAAIGRLKAEPEEMERLSVLANARVRERNTAPLQSERIPGTDRFGQRWLAG